MVVVGGLILKSSLPWVEVGGGGIIKSAVPGGGGKHSKVCKVYSNLM